MQHFWRYIIWKDRKFKESIKKIFSWFPEEKTIIPFLFLLWLYDLLGEDLIGGAPGGVQRMDYAPPRIVDFQQILVFIPLDSNFIALRRWNIAMNYLLDNFSSVSIFYLFLYVSTCYTIH